MAFRIKLRGLFAGAFFATAALSVLVPGVTYAQAAVGKLKAYAAIKPADAGDVQTTKAQANDAAGAASGAHLPLWLYDVESPRDDNNYTGVMIGNDPFNGGASASVKTFVVPVVIKTNSIGVAVNSKTGAITSQPGVTVFDPSSSDSCLSAPNNVPLSLFQQSPIFQNATFDFGGTIVGTTQYVDAFQRGNFWKVIGPDRDDYHVLLQPVVTLQPLVIDVPAANGTTFPPALSGGCAPLGIVDINWLDAYLDNVVLPSLKKVTPATFPIFLYHNVVQSGGTPSLANCCILGYHGTNGFPIQTYSPADFDTTGLFASALQDTGVLSHEVAEWMNDPFGNNATPAWGDTGQVVGACQNNLEVGDPLTGTNAPPIVMPNGFTYHLQELAFFSWFFGGPSVGIHGWYSDNATFLTDAGPVCVTPAPAAATPGGWRLIPLGQ